MPADLRLRTHFFNLPDPRRAGRSPYRLLDLIFIAIAATVAGAQDFGQVEVFARKRRDWLARYCQLPQDEEGGPLTPCQDTFERLFKRLNPRHFAGCLASWTAALAEGLGIKHVAIDGTARSARCRSHHLDPGRLCVLLTGYGQGLEFEVVWPPPWRGGRSRTSSTSTPAGCACC
jgi:hypothetical protein